MLQLQQDGNFWRNNINLGDYIEVELLSSYKWAHDCVYVAKLCIHLHASEGKLTTLHEVNTRTKIGKIWFDNLDQLKVLYRVKSIIVEDYYIPQIKLIGELADGCNGV